jgi:hypothetical protein
MSKYRHKHVFENGNSKAGQTQCDLSIRVFLTLQENIESDRECFHLPSDTIKRAEHCSVPRIVAMIDLKLTPALGKQTKPERQRTMNERYDTRI